MLKDKMRLVAIICLSISIIVSANIISDGMKNCGGNISSGFFSVSGGLNSIASTISNSNRNNEVVERNTFSLETASNYLGVTEDTLIKIIKSKTSGIPYIKMGDFYILNKEALNKWLETARVEVK
jgi:excisionase family DNA binding protein